MMRIAIICNDRLGLPALQQLVQNRLVQAVATSDRSPEMIGIMKLVTQQGGVPSTIFKKNNFENDLTDWLSKYQPDLVMVMTFPFRIPDSALRIPKFGFINFHYAPLPEFRGSNPLFWMIKEGLTAGGVTVHKMDHDFDTGPILLQERVEFPSHVTFGLASTLLGHAGARLAVQLIHAISSGSMKETEQPKTPQRWYGRPTAKDLIIDWKNLSAPEIISLINACNPWLKGAPTYWRGTPINIISASMCESEEKHNAIPGTILQISELGLIVACKESTAMNIHVIYIEQGYYAGHELQRFGLGKGTVFGQ